MAHGVGVGVGVNVAVAVAVAVGAAVTVAVAVAVGATVAVAVAVGVGVGVASDVTNKDFASLGIPLVNTVMTAMPEGNAVRGVDVKFVSDHPSTGLTERKVSSSFPRLRNWTMG